MKKMKRILAILLATALIFSLFGCSGKKDSSTTDETTTAGQEETTTVADKETDGDEEETDQRQDEGYVYSRVAGDSSHVYDSSLQWGHDGTANDGHDKEGCSKWCVSAVNVLQGYAVDGGEHQGHEGRDAHKAVEAGHANN